MAEKIRLQFDFSPEAVRELDQTKNHMNLTLTSRVDIVKQALGLLQWVLDTKKEGYKLLVEKAGEQHIVVLPHFQNGHLIGTERVERLQLLKQYFLKNLVEDPIDGSAFDCDVLDAFKMLEEKHKN